MKRPEESTCDGEKKRRVDAEEFHWEENWGTVLFQPERGEIVFDGDYMYFPKWNPDGSVAAFALNLKTREVEDITQWSWLQHKDKYDEDYFLDEDGEPVENVFDIGLPHRRFVWMDKAGEEVCFGDFHFIVETDHGIKGEPDRPAFVVYGFGVGEQSQGFGTRTMREMHAALKKFGWKPEVVVPHEERDPSAKSFWNKMSDLGYVV